MTNISISDIVAHLNRKVSIIRDSLAGNIDFFHCQKSLILVFLVVVLVPLKDMYRLCIM